MLQSKSSIPFLNLKGIAKSPEFCQPLDNESQSHKISQVD
jgi:hypothetical protein